jgi:periplasmic divalent cation tolerance protein
MTDFQIVLSTCADREQAERIARSLVEQRLAACVNILPGVQSVYRWQGNVESASEVLLVIKTSADLVPGVEATIANLH